MIYNHFWNFCHRNSEYFNAFESLNQTSGSKHFNFNCKSFLSRICKTHSSSMAVRCFSYHLEILRRRCNATSAWGSNKRTKIIQADRGPLSFLKKKNNMIFFKIQMRMYLVVMKKREWTRVMGQRFSGQRVAGTSLRSNVMGAKAGGFYTVDVTLNLRCIVRTLDFPTCRDPLQSPTCYFASRTYIYREFRSIADV